MTNNLLSIAWRKCKYLDQNTAITGKKQGIRQRLKDTIINYKPLHELMPLHHTFPRVNILLFGAVESGKSSVFNTISSLFKGKIFNIARCGRSSGSFTTKLTKFQVMYGGIAEQLRLTLWDTRGIDETHLMAPQNMKILLKGNLPDRYPLDPSLEVHLDSPGINTIPTLCDVVHCVSIVVDATTIDDMDDNIYRNICQMQTVMNSLDVQHVILLTNIDKICELTKKDATYAYKSKAIQEAVEKVAKKFGVPRNAVFIMKCYEEESFLDDNVDIMTLLALSGILQHCDAYLYRFYESVIDLASKQASLEEENKSLKVEMEEYKSIVKNFKRQFESSQIRQKKKDVVIYDDKMLSNLITESDVLNKEIDRLRDRRDHLKEDINNVK
ncbi:Interferon-induced protein 44-like [Mactra antiquata]